MEEKRLNTYVSDGVVFKANQVYQGSSFSFKAKEEVSSDLKVGAVTVNMGGKAEKEGRSPK